MAYRNLQDDDNSGWSWHRKIAVLMGGIDYTQWLTDNFPNVDRWDHQDLPGSSVLEAYNTAATVPDTRSVALVTYGDYVAGANWANSSGQIARHTVGSVETFQQDDILAPGKTYQVTITLANVTAGSVTITDGGAAISANEQTTRTITSTGTDFIITPTTDFDGDIDVAIILVQQTDIAASNTFPGAELLDNPNFINWTGVAPADTPDDWTTVEVGDGTSNVTENPADNLQLISDGTATNISQDKMTSGKRYGYEIITSAFSLGSMDVANSSPLFTVLETISSVGTFIKEFVTVGTQLFLNRTIGQTTDITVQSASLTERNPMNGDTTAAQVGVPTNFGSLGLSVVDDGATSFSNFYSAEVNSKFNPAAGFVNIWLKINSWAGTQFAFNLRADANNQVNIIIFGGDLLVRHITGGTNRTRTILPSGSTTDWLMATLSYGPATFGYLNGLPIGGSVGAVGDWVGNFISSEVAVGASTTVPASVLNGSRTRFMLGYEQPTDAQVLSIYNNGRR